MKCYVYLEEQRWFCNHCDYSNNRNKKDWADLVADIEGCSRDEAIAMMDAQYPQRRTLQPVTKSGGPN